MAHDTQRVTGNNVNGLTEGPVVWRPIKSIWMIGMTTAALTLGPATASWNAIAVFVVLTSITLCCGHSVGMHRRLIHSSFECPKWLEYLLVYLGVLVGMAGPIGMIRQHDLRDWAQRQSQCHPYLCHERGIVTDYWWQVHCDVKLTNPPIIKLEDRIANDPVYRWMESTWMLQQLPLAIGLYLWGGWEYVVWGVAVRVAVSVTGHWLVGYFAHHEQGPTNDRMSWRILGASVQGRDVKLAGLISMGESWHNNHHAFPGSAKIGLHPGQPDAGWWFISVLQKAGLAWNIVLPEHLPSRTGLIRLSSDEDAGCPVCRLRRRIWNKVFP